jgi:eukaryotic-like serine/threonine-protein kinase
MDYLISELFENTYVHIGLGLILLYLLYTKVLSNVRVKGPSGFGMDDLLGRVLGAEARVERAVAREKKRGSYLAAGRLYEDAEKLPQAVEAYTEGQEYHAAASVLEQMGKHEKAAEMYLQAGDYKKSAQVFAHAGKPGRAATLFLEKGNTLEAARLFGIAQDWGKAAELYVRSGYPLRAAEAFEKKGDYLRAAECHEKHFMENVSYSTTYSSTAASVDQKSALLAGRLYEKAGDLNRAFQIYSKGSYFKQAAAALSALGQHAKAAELFMRAEDPENAADAFEQAGDSVKSATLRGEVALKADRVAEAAAFFQKGQDYLRAAELFESVGMLAEAAGAYEAGDSFAAAGGVYVRAGLKDKAAHSYERAGEFETAAKFYEEAGNGAKAIELYERAGLTFKSGEAAAKAGDRERAIALLQRVAPEDENYRPATQTLARLFLEGRMPALAIERLQRVLGQDPVASSNLELYYWLAAAYEASGNAAEALGLYKKIQAENLSFRDVTARRSRLEQGGAATARASAPAPPPAPAALPPPAPSAPPAAPPAPPAAAPRAPMPAPVAPPAAPPPAPPPPRAAPVAPGPPTPPAAPRAPAPASRSQRFVRKEEIGRGPMGVVHRAEDSRDGRSVALRILPAELLRREGAQSALVAELKAASQLSHPNIVKVLGFVDLGGERAVVTELVSGRNFGEALKAGHKMAFQQTHSLGRVLAQALSFIHGKGLVHGSLQPSNVMVASGVVKLSDLGLGSLGFPLPRAESYRAPENKLDVAGDLYALASILYHLLTGVHPRTQPQGPALPLPSRLAAGVPEAFDKLLVRCLHPNPELRFTTADEVLGELKDMVRIG